MSLNNSFIFGSQQRGQSQNPIGNYDGERFQCKTEGPLSLGLQHLASDNLGQGNNDNLPHSRQLQLHRLLTQQQQMATVPSPIGHSQHPGMQQSQPQQQPKAKKPKEPVLKTALSLLNEVCAKAKAVPVFTLEETGPVHMRVYNCVVKVDTHGFACEASASGKTKKDAKQEAAKALLVKMDDDVEQYLIPTVTKEEPVTPIIEVDPEVPGNPVGNLNDLCTKLKRLPPEYEDVSEVGKPHERVYTVACKLGSHIVEAGRGRSKKNAKKAAAYRVHKRVMEMLSESDGAAMLKDDDDLIEKLNSLTLVSKKEAKKITDDWKLSEWLDNLKNRSGPKLDQFKDPTARLPPNDPFKLLKEISEEQKFKLEFTELVDNRNTDIKKYLIAISSGNQPLTVLMGSAGSKTQAKKNAAENFIEMLSLVLASPSC